MKQIGNVCCTVYGFLVGAFIAWGLAVWIVHGGEDKGDDVQGGDHGT